MIYKIKRFSSISFLFNLKRNCYIDPNINNKKDVINKAWENIVKKIYKVEHEYSKTKFSLNDYKDNLQAEKIEFEDGNIDILFSPTNKLLTHYSSDFFWDIVINPSTGNIINILSGD